MNMDLTIHREDILPLLDAVKEVPEWNNAAG